MTTVTLTGTVAAGYELTAPITILTIARSGYVEGAGVYTLPSATASYGLDVFGRISSADGSAVYLADGGSVSNGNVGDDSALIEGVSGVRIEGAFGTVANAGSIFASGGSGVDLAGGGMLTNGALGATQALIAGASGVAVAGGAGTIINFATVVGEGSSSTLGAGVYLADGGSVANGAIVDRAALIEGYDGVLVAGAGASVKNFATILATGVSGATYGVELTEGGSATNGSVVDTGALIEGYDGVSVSSAAGSLTNFGTILASAYGVRLNAGGDLTNGAAADHGALIEGYYGGVSLAGSIVRAINFGTILATGGNGVDDRAGGGLFMNGAVTDATALIEGYDGFNLDGAGSVVNYGTIRGDGVGKSDGVILPGTMTNGDADDRTALIEGVTGVMAYEHATLTNYGTVVGERGGAVSGLTFGAGGGGSLIGPTVVGEAGSVFSGAVTGIASLQLVAGIVTMSGLQTEGTVSGAGTLALDGGASMFDDGIDLAIPQIDVSGATALIDEESTSLAYAGTWLQSAGTVDVFAGDAFTFDGVGDSFAGTVTGPGAVVFSGGSDTLDDLTLSAARQTIKNAAVILSGDITLADNLIATSSSMIVAAEGATLSGSGELRLTSAATNALFGANDGATFTDDGRLSGAGQLGAGQMTLIIGAQGLVDGSTGTALTIDTAANTIHNGGVIEASAAGGVIIDSAVDNTGKLYADGGDLTLNGAVSGPGTATIASAELIANSGFTLNVTFKGHGALELADSQTYTGAISGFSVNGSTILDLSDIPYTAETTATFKGSTTSGVLAVSDGTVTALITLEGNFTGAAFGLTADVRGGTDVSAQVVKQGEAPPLAAAMASFGAPAATYHFAPLNRPPEARVIAAARVDVA